MLAALIFVMSVAALAQFAVFTWRAGLLSMAEQPLSQELCKTAGISASSIGAKDFEALSSLQQMCPELKQASHELWPVRAYFQVVRVLAWLGGAKLPIWAAWANREMATCTRYLAVVMDQRLQSNKACFAQVRSY